MARFSFGIDKKSEYPSSDFRSRNYKGNWVKHYINKYVDSLGLIGIDSTQKQMSEYKIEHLPTYLYKFMPPTIYSLINIYHQSVYIASARNFNDPFDSYACINKESFVKLFLAEKLKNLGLVSEAGNSNNLSKKEYWELYYSRVENDKNLNVKSFWTTFNNICSAKSPEFSKLLNDLIIDSIGACNSKLEYIRNISYRISCFSNFEGEKELMENTTMWSHYADNHRGFCIKYLLNFEDVKYKDKILSGLFPVSYTSTPQSISPRELYKLQIQDDKLKLSQSVQKTVLKSLTTKSKFWNYEKEWRLILNENDTALLYDNSIPFLKIDSIYLGCRVEPTVKKFITNLADASGFGLFQTKQSDEKFILSSYSLNSKSQQWDEFHKKLWQIRNIKDKQEQSLLIQSLYKEDFPI